MELFPWRIASSRLHEKGGVVKRYNSECRTIFPSYFNKLLKLSGLNLKLWNCWITLNENISTQEISSVYTSVAAHNVCGWSLLWQRSLTIEVLQFQAWKRSSTPTDSAVGTIIVSRGSPLLTMERFTKSTIFDRTNSLLNPRLFMSSLDILPSFATKSQINSQGSGPH